MNKMAGLGVYIGIWMFSVFISSVAQVMLKLAANRTYDKKIREYLNPLVIAAYSIFLISDCADDVCTEVCASDHVADRGVLQLYFCAGAGDFYAEGKSQQTQMAGDGNHGARYCDF